MAQVTLNIDGVGKVNVDDSFLKMTPEQQNAQIEEIVGAVHGGSASSAPAAAAPQSSAPAATPAAPKVVNLDPNKVWTALVNKESSNRAGVLGPMTQYGQAEGLAQTLPATAQRMAAKIGIPWRPDLLTGTSQQARDYQTAVGKAYFNEGLDLNHGDVRKALQYYYGGPKGQGPKAQAYASSIIAAAQGNPTLDVGNSNAPGNTQPQPNSPNPATSPMSLAGDSVTTDTAIPQFTDAQKAQIQKALPTFNTGADLDNYVANLVGNHNLRIGNSQQIVDYLKKGGDPSKLAWAAPDVQPSPQPQDPDVNPGHVGAVVARGAAQGGQDAISQGVNGLLGMILPPALIDKLDPGQAPQNAFNAIMGDFGKPQTYLDKYLSAISEGATGAAALGPDDIAQLPGLLKSGAGAGIGSQVAQNLGLPPMLGAIIGGGLAHPTLGDPIKQFIPGTEAKFVRDVASNPLGPELSEVAQDYGKQAEQTHPQGAAPSGRQPINVEDINNVGDRGLKGIRNIIAQQNIPQVDKLMLTRALDNAVTIPLERTPDMGPEQLALSDLTDAINNGQLAPVEGNAVVAAIRRAKAGDMLSARYGGEKLGMVGKAWNALLKLAPVPDLVTDIIKARGGDMQKSRMDAAAKAIKRIPLFQQAQAITGPSDFGPAMSALYDKADATAAARDAAQQANLAAAAKQKLAAQQQMASNNILARKLERTQVTPTDGYRGLIYQQTGVTQPMQDAALIHMVGNNELAPSQLRTILSNPRALMRGGSTAGLKVMDRIGQLADQGVVQRDPSWQGPPDPSQMPSGVLNWLDAQGQPIRSMGAYAGGIAKNIINELQSKSVDDAKLNAEVPPKPAKTKSTKKNKQGA